MPSDTHKQVILAGFALLAVATVPGEVPMAFITGSVPLFAISRIAFFGAAGMVTTSIPVLGGLAGVMHDMVARLL